MVLMFCGPLPLRIKLLQKEEDQLLHRVAGFRRSAGGSGSDALRRHRVDHRPLALWPGLLPSAHLTGRPADHCVHPAPVLHRAGQVSLFSGSAGIFKVTFTAIKL